MKLLILSLLSWILWLAGRQRLQELSRLRLLISCRICDLKLIPRKSDLDARADIRLLDDFLFTAFFILLLGLRLAGVADELVLLVQERKTSLDDLCCDQNFGYLHLESIEGDLPVILDLSDRVVDDLTNSGGSGNFDQHRLLIFVLLRH